MANFRFSARDAQGKAHRGTLAAETWSDVETALRNQNLFLIEAKEVKEHKETARGATDLRIPRRKLIDFTIELESSYSAGIPIVQAIDDLAREEDNSDLQKVLAAIAQRIKEGSAFSEALRVYPKAFPELYTSLIQAGERTGSLDKVMVSLVVFLEWQDDLVAQARQATIYPATIIVAVISLIVLLVSYVIPKFYDVFASLRVTLPLPTRILIASSDFMQHYGIALGIGTVALVVGVLVAGKTRRGRWWIDTAKLHLPMFGTLFRKLLLSRITHNLSMMLAAGIEVAAAFTMTENLVGNVVLGEMISRARSTILAGGLFSEAMGESRYVPRSIVRKLVVGETTGRMSTSLELIAQQYDKEIPRAIKRFFSLLEPTILVVLGGVVGFVALSLFLPLYQLQTAIGK